SFDVDSLSGVIIDVDEFDWAVPGNGIVIWHIDENVINEKIAENKVNTDKTRRGVDVEEADGVQDIGEVFYTIFGDQVIGEGFEEDFWYASNPSELFTNRFAKDTRPNTLTNTGANSLITIKDFSEIDNRMSFRVEFGDSVVKPLFTLDLMSEGEAKGLSVLTNDFGLTNYYALINSDLNVIDENLNTSEVDSFSNFKMAGTVQNNVQRSYGVSGSQLNARTATSGTFELTTTNIQEQLTSPLIISTNEQGLERLLLGTNDGKILFYESSGNPGLQDSFKVDTTNIIRQITADGDYFAFITESKIATIPPTPFTLFYDSEGHNYQFTAEQPLQLAVSKNENGNHIAIILTSNNNFYIIEKGEIISKFTMPTSVSILSFALADLKQDGSNYIVVNNGNNIEVYNLTGAMADNFPFSDPEGFGFVGTPLTSDFEGDSKSEIISVTKDGRIFAIDGGTGKIVPGFPISSGGSVSVTPVLYNASGKTNLAVLNDQNVLSAWSISSVEGKLYWSEEYGNPQNTSFIDAAENTNRINEFFPANRAYNYPNPVYEGTTNIRYYVAEDSKISIKIFDLAGDFVAELNDDAQGGMDNETVWNVGDIQSGVYLARIEANSTSGKTEQAVIKIAVVK
ncbi:MAG TPA: T9SS type A sorting domain-containing protein, partial [Ignavibacteriaceae bacterium]|nr:T9SS type A sorting domain-containing protein [Ignavibacteriaceae bacterium]